MEQKGFLADLLSSCDIFTFMTLGFCFALIHQNLGLELAAVLSGFYLIRGLGHFWGLRYCSVPVKSLRFVPPFGGYAETLEGFKFRVDEAFSSLGASIWVLIFATLCFLVYIHTGNLTCILFAMVSLGVNLVALLPIAPFDGGKVLKSLLFSTSRLAGMTFMFVNVFLTPTLLYLALSQRGEVDVLPIYMTLIDGVQRFSEEYKMNSESIAPMNKLQMKAISFLSLFIFLAFAFMPKLLGISAIPNAMQAGAASAIDLGIFGLIFISTFKRNVTFFVNLKRALL